MSDAVRPHRRQPTRLPRPWDSPGKNTGVGCHFLLQGMKVKSESEVTQSCLTLRDPMDCSLPGSSVHGIFLARVLEWAAIAFSSVLNFESCAFTLYSKVEFKNIIDTFDILLYLILTVILQGRYYYHCLQVRKFISEKVNNLSRPHN